MLGDRDAIHRTTMALAGGAARRLGWKVRERLGRPAPEREPLDRYYIEDFLSRHADVVRGQVLEVADDTYTRRFGGDRVERSDVLHATAGNPQATIVGRLEDEGALPAEAFDCIVVTQTLQLIYRAGEAVRTLHKALKPGGTVLATVPGIAGVSVYDATRWGDYWRYTEQSAQLLFDEAFPSGSVQVQVYGNRLTAIACLHGFSAAEIGEQGLRYRNEEYPVILGIAARKG